MILFKGVKKAGNNDKNTGGLRERDVRGLQL